MKQKLFFGLSESSEPAKSASSCALSLHGRTKLFRSKGWAYMWVPGCILEPSVFSVFRKDDLAAVFTI